MVKVVNRMDLKQIIAELSALAGPSGFEGTVAERAAEWMRRFLDEAHVDRFGNAVGIRRCGREGAKQVLLDAHLDEIGLIVTGVEDGFLRFCTIGGVDPRILPDREVTLLTDPPQFGLVACLPPHVQKAADYDKAIPVSDLWIDVGMSQEETEKRIPVGTPAVFRTSCTALGEKQLSGKSMDDRACFAVLLRAAELLQDKPLDMDLILLGSTREEVSMAGAAAGVFALAPDCCVAVDVTHGKTPDGPGESAFAVGKGPAVGVGPSMTRWMSSRFLEQAKQMELSVQTEVMAGSTGTNAWKMQIAREGIATAVLSVPLKYMHTPVETLSLSDAEDAARLLAAFVTDLGREGGWVE